MKTLIERLENASIDDGVSEPIQPDEYAKLCREAASALEALSQQAAEMWERAAKACDAAFQAGEPTEAVISAILASRIRALK